MAGVGLGKGAKLTTHQWSGVLGPNWPKKKPL
jgi:hypothetical protein